LMSSHEKTSLGLSSYYKNIVRFLFVAFCLNIYTQMSGFYDIIALGKKRVFLKR
jgi:hypothetical protein